jgi:hypothetical protein
LLFLWGRGGTITKNALTTYLWGMTTEGAESYKTVFASAQAAPTPVNAKSARKPDPSRTL